MIKTNYKEEQTIYAIVLKYNSNELLKTYQRKVDM